MLDTQGITRKQKEIYNYIVHYIKQNKLSPTVREIAETHETQVSNAKRYLDLLEASGHIIRQPMKARGIKLPPHISRPICYLASPYSLGGDSSEEEKAERFRQVTRQASELFSQGINVYSPITHHHTISIYGRGKLTEDLTTDEWMEFDLAFLQCSTKLCVLCLDKWQESSGVKREIQHAQDMGIEIEYIDPSPFVIHGEDLVI
jgi:predicted transcriptional regulator|tara:strand:+ start:1619 stop:2230 length:612 start_codon:yes stop_codon:yes gene_type:complete